jgi:hypothetical protein
MKHVLIVLFSLLLIKGSNAQTGIYLTAEDYQNGKLTYQELPGEKHSLRTEILLNPSIVRVVNGNEKHKLIKIDLFGYKKKNRDFRFFDDKAYRIVDPSSFFIYSREVNVINGKAKTRETRYYFSKSGDSPVMPLTINNLKRAFPGNRNFHDLLDLQFRSDRELMKFDPYYSEYKVKSVFKRAMI